MSRKGNTAVYANLTQADAARLRGLLDGRTLNDYVRDLISSDLEDLGEPPLERLVYERQRKAKARAAGLQHGTLTGYSYFRCRCDRCREARRVYYRQWKAAGACTTL